MAKDVNLNFRLLGTDVSASKALHGVGTAGIALGTALGGLAAGALVEVVGGFGSLVSAARASEAQNRITQQVIKTTGGAAHITAGQVDALATSISNKTGVDDDAVKSGENMLLTFTNVRNEVGKGNDIFNQATGIVTDMSVALGQDTKSSAIQLGKALNDPIKGITALQRVGVSFTDAQRKQIASLVKHGDTLGAQKVIMKELGREFGGAATAAADPMQKLGTQLSNTGKSIAAQLLPYLNKAADWISKSLIPAVQAFIPKIALLAQWIGAHLGPVFAAVTGFIISTVIPAIQNLAKQFMENIWPAIKTVVGVIAQNLQPVVKALSDFWNNTLLPNIQKLMPILGRVAQVIGVVVGVLAVLVSWIVGKVAPIFFNVLGKAISFVITILGWVADKVGFVIDHFGQFVDFVKGIPGKIGDALRTVANVITAPFRTAFNALADIYNNTIGRLSITIPDWVPGIGGRGFSFPQMPHIPALANGGIVSRPTLALIGEAGPEAVVPLSRGGGFGGATVNIYVQGDTDPLGAARRIAQIMQTGRQNGLAF